MYRLVFGYTDGSETKIYFEDIIKYKMGALDIMNSAMSPKYVLQPNSLVEACIRSVYDPAVKLV